MSFSRIGGFRVAGIATCVPPLVVDNLACGAQYGEVEVRKVVAMAGVKRRHVVDAGVTAADLCFVAAKDLLARLNWSPESITGLIFVTQSPDYWLPSTSCVLHKLLGLPPSCAAFDVGLGCSGYPYGLYLAASMLRAGGQQRILLLHGETPSKFTSPEDHATTLLFSDAGSATALEMDAQAQDSVFGLFTDGMGFQDLIIRGGGFRNRSPENPRDQFLSMDGAAIFNFTVKRVPELIKDTLQFGGWTVADIDQYFFHQSNRFIMKHIAKKCGLPESSVPIVLEDFGNSGGPSVPLVLTQSMAADRSAAVRAMLLGYGVGLSWASAVTQIEPNALLIHSEYDTRHAPH
ncbi:MAG: hypothetical protein RL341_2295 [Pseudomonadota bacterium]